MTRADIWDKLPAAVKVNRVRFEAVLDEEDGLWLKERRPGRGGPMGYRRVGGMRSETLPD